jgi:hypothetical protein
MTGSRNASLLQSMSASPANHEFDDELLSAYVDNELTAAERAAVEERLRTDEQARQLVAELRAASDAVRSLPRTTLGPDFAASILGEIERRHPQSQSNAAAAASVVTRPPSESRRSGARGMAYAMFAVAAALLVMVVLHGEDRPNEGQVAQNGPPPRIGADPAAVEKAEGRRDDFGVDRGGESARTAAAPMERDERSGAAEMLGRAASEEQAQAQAERRDSAVASAPVPSAPVPPPAAPAAAQPATAPLEAAADPAAAQLAATADGGAADADFSPPGDAAESQPGNGALATDEVRQQVLGRDVATYEYAVASDQDVAQFESLLAASGITIVDGAPAELPADTAKQLAGESVADISADQVPQASAYFVDATPAQLETLLAALNANEGKLRTADGSALPENVMAESAPERARRGGFGGGGGMGGGGGGGFGARGGGATRELATGRAWRLSTLAKGSADQLADQEQKAAATDAALEADDNLDAAARGDRGGRAPGAAEPAAPSRAIILLRREPTIVPAEAQP